MEDYRKIAIEFGQTLINKAPETREDVERMLPELKESEDEKMSRELIAYFKNNSVYVKWSGLDVKKVIQWLEKQGEQKPADKIEPKFHEGDWTVSNLDKKARQISEVHFDEYNRYYVVNGKSVNLKEYDRLHHLWTIQDAKDGDVLHCWIDGDEFVLIYKGIKDGYITTYGHLYQKFKSFSEEPTTMFCRTIQGHFTPATKEQRDILFNKMKENGYEWDAEKKELKKNCIIPIFKVDDEIVEHNEFGTIRGKITDIDATHYELDYGNRYIPISQQNYFKLVDSKKEPCPSEVTKESDQEMTKFEEAVGVSIGAWHPNEEGKKKVKAVANKLLSIARKQIASEIDAERMTEENYRPGKINPYFGQASTEKKAYRQGIEDALKALEKGGKND